MEWDKVKPDMTVEDRYYKKSEYMKLSQAKKKGLALHRQNRGHKKSGKSSSNAKGFSLREVKMLRKFASMKIKAKADEMDTSDEESDDGGSDKENESKKSNRNIKALTRKK